jgi:cyclase
MLARRLIACLDVRDGQVVKGVNFEGLRLAGDPASLARRYNADGIDELVLLDVTATLEGRRTFLDTVRSVAQELFIPLSVGGGISSLDSAKAVFDAGADKVSINSAALRTPELITHIARVYGSQAVIVAIDAQTMEGAQAAWSVHSRSGTHREDRNAVGWAQEAAERGAGEILLTSIDRDGTKSGFDCVLTAAVSDAVNIPVIASGGAGTFEHFADVFTSGHADAALAASVFHFSEHAVSDLKQFLIAREIPIRPC